MAIGAKSTAATPVEIGATTGSRLRAPATQKIAAGGQ